MVTTLLITRMTRRILNKASIGAYINFFFVLLQPFLIIIIWVIIDVYKNTRNIKFLTVILFWLKWFYSYNVNKINVD